MPRRHVISGLRVGPGRIMLHLIHGQCSDLCPGACLTHNHRPVRHHMLSGFCHMPYAPAKCGNIQLGFQSHGRPLGDPVALVDNAGRFYYIHLPDSMERVVCHRRDNISADWSMESSVAFTTIYDVDKEWAAYDPVNDSICLSWT